MALAEQYPTIESLPVYPVRVCAPASRRRLRWICWISPILFVPFYEAVCRGLLDTSHPPGVLLLIFVAAAVQCGIVRVVVISLLPNIEVSRHGVRQVGWLRFGTMFSWDDFHEQRVAYGRGPHHYCLLDQQGKKTTDLCLTRSCCVDTDFADLDWIHELIRSIHVAPHVVAPKVLFVRTDRIIMASVSGLTLIEAPDVRHYRLDRWLVAGQDQARGGNHAAWNSLEAQWSDGLVPWDAIDQLDIWQLEHGRPDFEQVTVHLRHGGDNIPQEPLQLKFRRGNKNCFNFGGTTPECLLSLLLAHVDAKRIQLSAYHGKPRSREECDRRDAKITLEKQNRISSLKQNLVVMAGLAAIGCLPVWSGEARARWLILPVLCSPVFAVALHQTQLKLKRFRKQLARWRAEIETA